MLKILSIITTLLVLNLISLEITDTNHKPYVINKAEKIGTFAGNMFYHTLVGRDPDDNDEIFFEIDNKSELDGKLVFCEIFHSNQLACEVDKDFTVATSSTCQVNDNYTMPNCQEVEIKIHAIDNHQLKSDSAKIRLFVAETEIDDKYLKNDPTNNPRAFLSEMKAKNSVFDGDVILNLEQSDLFSDPNSIFAKQMSVGLDAIDSGDGTALQSNKILNNNNAANVLGDSIASVDTTMVGNLIEDSINSISYNNLNIPVDCYIEREDSHLLTYYVCETDPLLKSNPSLATKYVYASTNGKDTAYNTCKSNCINTQTCNENDIEIFTEFIKNLNYLDDSMYNTVMHNILNMDRANQIILYKKSTTGTVLDTVIIDKNLENSDITWDTTIVPSINRLANNLEFHVEFMGTDKFDVATEGNSFVITPKISYWIKASGQEFLKSYDASNLYTVVFKSKEKKYKCPIPSLDNKYYTYEDSCNSACSLEHDCLKMMKQSMQNTNGSTIHNYCKDKTVAINGARISLQQAVEDGACKLQEEYSISNEEISKYYIKNYILQDGFRPNLGFSEDESVLNNEKAVEVSYAFTDMLRNGSNQYRIDSTPLLNDNTLFQDFSFKESDDFHKSLAVTTGRNFTDMSVYILTKFNQKYFTVDNEKIFSDANITTDQENNIYLAYSKVLQREPTFGEVDNIKSDSSLSTLQRIEDAVYDKSLADDDTIGISIGLFEVKEPLVKDENTTYKTNFYLMDNTQTLRLVTSTGGDVKIQDEDSEFLYNEYLKYLGREPDLGGFLWWLKDLQAGTAQSTLDNNFKQAILETPHRMQENIYYMEDIADKNPSEPIFNSFLNNLSLARKGVFDKKTMSFGVSSETSESDKRETSDVIVNKYIYNKKLSTNFMFLKSLKNSESLISRPIKINSKSFGVETDSLAGYTYYYLFAYVDKASNMKDKTVNDLLDLLWDDFKSGTKKYFVWDYVDRSAATKLLSDTVTTWKGSESINAFGGYFKPNHFKINSNKDIVTSAFEDNSKIKDDNVYLAKRGDNYIVKLAAADNRAYNGNACSDTEYYDAVANKCIAKDIADNNPFPAENDFTPTNCPEANASIDESGRCYTKSNPLLNVSNQNGYYFLYLKNEVTNEIKFITPLVDSSEILCKNTYVKCDINNQFFNSKKSCLQYCKELDDNTVVSGNCEENIVPPVNLKDTVYYDYDSCNASCFVTSEKTLPFINAKIRIGDEIATFKSDITIKRFNADSSQEDYSNLLVQSNGNVYLSGDNSGISLKNLIKDDELVITYNTVTIDNKYQIGLGKADENLLSSSNNLISGYVPSDTMTSCANMNIYYPSMGIYLDLDLDGDGFADKSIRISDTFVCNPTAVKSISQSIKFLGNKINYDYIDERGVKTNKTENITIADNGECLSSNATNTSKVALAQQYLSSDYVPTVEKLNVNIDGTNTDSQISFARKDIKGTTGLITKTSNQVEQILSNTVPAEIFNRINIDKNIPIPFYKGIEDSDDVDVYIKNTGLDSKINSSTSDYTLNAGYGYTPWEECRSYLQTDVVTVSDDFPKTTCLDFGIYNENTKLCEKNAEYEYTQIPTKTIKVKSLGYEDDEYAYYKGVPISGFITAHNLFDPNYLGFGIETITKAERKIAEENGFDAVGVTIDGVSLDGNNRGVRLTVLDADDKLISSEVYDVWGNGTAKLNLITKLEDTYNNAQKNTTIIINTIDAWVPNDKTTFNDKLKSFGGSSYYLDNAAFRSSYILVSVKGDNTWSAIAEKYIEANSEVGVAENIVLTKSLLSFNCPQGTLKEDGIKHICTKAPTCPTDTEDDPNNIENCKKDRFVTVKRYKKICKPWWKIKRTYVCNDVDSGFNFIDNISVGVSRVVDICKETKKFDKGFSIINGNVELGN